jgi:hypothetical protein
MRELAPQTSLGLGREKLRHVQGLEVQDDADERCFAIVVEGIAERAEHDVRLELTEEAGHTARASQGPIRAREFLQNGGRREGRKQRVGAQGGVIGGAAAPCGSVYTDAPRVRRVEGREVVVVGRVGQ